MKIPPPSDSTVSRMYKYWETNVNQEQRPHLGASQIGRPCEREIWYSFRWAKSQSFDGRMLRLFNRGQREEAVIEMELKGSGIKFIALDPDTGKQYEFKDCDGHFMAHLDGVALGLPEAPKTWHLVEIKTHSDDSYKKVSKLGVKEAKPEHYEQMMSGMGMGGLDRALYIAVNKNNDEIYTERIEFDKKEWARIKTKARSIIVSNEAPAKIAESPAYFICKMCNFHGVCHCDEPADRNCRTCQNSIAIEDGKWKCSIVSGYLKVGFQRVGCPDGYKRIDGMGKCDDTAKAFSEVPF